MQQRNDPLSKQPEAAQTQPTTLVRSERSSCGVSLIQQESPENTPWGGPLSTHSSKRNAWPAGMQQPVSAPLRTEISSSEPTSAVQLFPSRSRDGTTWLLRLTCQRGRARRAELRQRRLSATV